ncbi:hypothetical protein AB0395_16435 [Streptosporangium sp. NPDC051023]|uniref:hypothetical protein n=1 Tax=Streptosporangium sp. NPDC051023 TaxID=3155410 RepID=UPI00344ED987
MNDTSAGSAAGAELARLRGLLRAGASRLPDGFSARPRDGWVPPFRAADQDCRFLLDTAGGGPAESGEGTWVAVTYPGDRLGELAGVSLASYAGQEAELHFAELTQALSGCRVARNSLPGRRTSFKVSELKLDAAGAVVQARRLHGRLNGYPYEMHVVFALAGHTLVSLVHTGVADVDAGRTGQLARSLIGQTPS